MLELSDRECKILYNWYIKDYLRKDGEYLLHEKLEKYQQIDEDCKKSNGRSVVKKDVMCCGVLGLADSGQQEVTLGGYSEESTHRWESCSQIHKDSTWVSVRPGQISSLG